MKSIFLCSFVFSGLILSAYADSLECHHTKPSIPEDWIDMAPTCTNTLKTHIQAELNAAMQYLAMAAHFSQDSVNRPGFAKMFFQSASEEREHAMKLISYLIMRGELTQDVSKLIKKNVVVTKTEWASGVEALKQALVMEANVTKAIRNVIKQCEDSDDKHDPTKKFNDYHLVDYLTGDFLDEQYKGQKEIASKISNLEKLMNMHGDLGEFLFDKKLLE